MCLPLEKGEEVMWRVMIADDEPYIREGLEKLIPWEELGCELIYVAENGQESVGTDPQLSAGYCDH